MKNHNLSIGIFGGLFDPPHIGHLILSQWVLEEFDLNKIVFVPAYNPPHKEKFSSYDDRYKMTQLAIKSNRDFIISDIEKQIKGKTYTVEVIKKFKEIINSVHLPPFRKGRRNKSKERKLYLIIGADQWQEIRHWKNPETIFSETKVIVLPRPGHKITKIRPFYNKILVSNAPLINISSTMIRTRIKNGLCIEYFVNPEVLEYIKKNRLYF